MARGEQGLEIPLALRNQLKWAEEVETPAKQTYIRSCRTLKGRGEYPVIPDGRYFVVRGRLWSCSNLDLPAERRDALTRELID